MKDYAFSKYIVALRHRQSLSRFDLARKLGIGYVTVAKWENAEAIPTREELEKLSVFFNLSCEAMRAYSFTELPGCSVKPREVNTATVAVTAPTEVLTPVVEPTPIEEAPTPVAPAPVAPAPAPAAPAPAPVATVPQVAATPVAEPASETNEPIASSTAEPIATSTAEPIVSTTDAPAIDLNVIKNPETKAFFEKKRIEMTNELIVSSHKKFGVKIRRLFAIFIDAIFSGIVAGIVAIAAATLLLGLSFTENDTIGITMAVLYVVGCLAFALRDAIIGGTSLGKRIFGLCVVDKDNATKPVVWQRVVRSLGQVFISGLDTIFVLISGRGIGDYVAGTAVVSRKDYNKRLAEKNPLDPPVKARKNRTGLTAFLIVAAIAAVTALIVGAVYVSMVMLENEKQTEEYLYAYEALVESDEFTATGADSSELIFTAFDRYTTLEDGGSVTIVEYTFETEEYYIYVTVESSVDGIAVTDIEVESIYALE